MQSSHKVKKLFVTFMLVNFITFCLFASKKTYKRRITADAADRVQQSIYAREL